MNDLFGTILKIIGFILFFGSVLFLVIVTTKLIGTKAKQAMKGKYIHVIDSINLGLDKSIYLVKVSDDFILLSSSGKKIEFLTNVKVENSFENNTNDENNEIFNFKSIFDKYLKKEENDNFTSNNRNNNAFNYNIARIKKIANKFHTNDKKFGDDSKDERNNS
jgi:flagellar biogenesis protein FliO